MFPAFFSDNATITTLRHFLLHSQVYLWGKCLEHRREYWQNYLQKRGVPNAGAVAQWLRVSTVLAEDWSLVLSTHIMWLTTHCLLTPAKGGNPTPLASSGTCTHNTHTHTLAHSHMCACTLKHKTLKKKSCATNTPIHESSSREASPSPGESPRHPV